MSSQRGYPTEWDSIFDCIEIECARLAGIAHASDDTATWSEGERRLRDQLRTLQQKEADLPIYFQGDVLVNFTKRAATIRDKVVTDADALNKRASQRAAKIELERRSADTSRSNAKYLDRAIMRRDKPAQGQRRAPRSVERAPASKSSSDSSGLERKVEALEKRIKDLELLSLLEYKGRYYYGNSYRVGDIVSGVDEEKGLTYLYLCKHAAPARGTPGMDVQDHWFYLGALGERNRLLEDAS